MPDQAGPGRPARAGTAPETPGPPAAAWSLTRRGTGRPLVAGDVVLAQARVAHWLDDLEDRAFLDSNPDGPMDIPLDEQQLLPEVFESLVGRLVGSVVVIPVSGTKHGLGVGRFYLKIEIIDVRERAAEAVHRIATRVLGAHEATRTPADPDAELLREAAGPLRRALEHTHLQRNGLVVVFDTVSARAFAALAARTVSTDGALSAPLRIESGDPATTAFLMSEAFLVAARAVLADVDRRGVDGPG